MRFLIGVSVIKFSQKLCCWCVMKNKHLLFVLFLYINSIYAQNRNEFTVTDSASNASFTIDKNGLIHAVWVHGEYLHLYYSLLDRNVM